MVKVNAILHNTLCQVFQSCLPRVLGFTSSRYLSAPSLSIIAQHSTSIYDSPLRNPKLVVLEFRQHCFSVTTHCDTAALMVPPASTSNVHALREDVSQLQMWLHDSQTESNLLRSQLAQAREAAFRLGIDLQESRATAEQLQGQLNETNLALKESREAFGKMKTDNQRTFVALVKQSNDGKAGIAKWIQANDALKKELQQSRIELERLHLTFGDPKFVEQRQDLLMQALQERGLVLWSDVIGLQDASLKKMNELIVAIQQSSVRSGSVGDLLSAGDADAISEEVLVPEVAEKATVDEPGTQVDSQQSRPAAKPGMKYYFGFDADAITGVPHQQDPDLSETTPSGSTAEHGLYGPSDVDSEQGPSKPYASNSSFGAFNPYHQTAMRPTLVGSSSYAAGNSTTGSARINPSPSAERYPSTNRPQANYLTHITTDRAMSRNASHNHTATKTQPLPNSVATAGTRLEPFSPTYGYKTADSSPVQKGKGRDTSRTSGLPSRKAYEFSSGRRNNGGSGRSHRPSTSRGSGRGGSTAQGKGKGRRVDNDQDVQKR